MKKENGISACGVIAFNGLWRQQVKGKKEVGGGLHDFWGVKREMSTKNFDESRWTSGEKYEKKYEW